MKKNGFTIIEITISITLLLLLALLVVPNLFDLKDASKEKMYNTKIDLVLSKAYKYAYDHIDDLTSDCTSVTIGKLISEGYVIADDEEGNNLINPITDESMNNIVICISYIDREVVVNLK